MDENGDYAVDNWFVRVAPAVYNMTVEEAKDQFSSLEGIKEFAEQFKVGDFVSDFLLNVPDMVGHKLVMETIDGEDGESVVNYSASGWFEIIAGDIYDMNARTAIDTFTNLTEAKNFLAKYRIGDYVAQIINTLTNAINAEHNIHLDENGDYAVDNWFVRVLPMVYNLTVTDALDTFVSVGDVIEFFGDNKVGDFTIDIVSNTVSNFINRSVSYEDGEYIVTGLFAPVAYDIDNMKVRDAYETFTNSAKDFFFAYKLGDYTEELLVMAKNAGFYDGSITKGEDGAYTAEGDFHRLIALLSDKTIAEYEDGFAEDKLAYLTSDDMIGGFKIGELFGNGRYVNVGKRWDNEDGTPVDFGSGTNAVLMKHIYNLKVSVLLGMDINEILGGLYIGQFMGYTCPDEVIDDQHDHDDDCVWVEEKEAGSVVITGEGLNGEAVYVVIEALKNCIAQKELVSMLRGGFDIPSLIGDELRLGELFRLSEKDGVWYSTKADEVELVSGKTYYRYAIDKRQSELYQAISDILAKDLFEGNAIELIIDKLKALKIGYVMNYYYSNGKTADKGWYSTEDFAPGTKLLGLKGLLADFSIDDITNGASYNSWEVGSLMSLDKRSDGVWYESNSPSARPATGVISLLADLTVGELSGSSGDGFLAIVHGWPIGQVLESKKFAGNVVVSYDDESSKWKYYGRTFLDYEEDEETGEKFWLEGETVILDVYDEVGNVWKNSDGSIVLSYDAAKGVYINDDYVAATSYDAVTKRIYDGRTLLEYSDEAHGWKDGDTVIADVYDGVNNVWKNSDGSITLSFDGEKGVYINADYVAASTVWKRDDDLSVVEGLNAVIYDYTVGELIEEDMTELVGDWYVGDIMGYTKGSDGNWSKTVGSEVKIANSFNKKLFDYRVSALMNGFDAVIDDFYVGEVMGYEKDAATGDWSKTVGSEIVTADAFDKKLFDYKVSAFTGGFDAVISEWYVGDIMGYEKDGGVWKKNGVSATATNQKLYGLKISDLKGDFFSVIDEWYVGEIMGYEKDGGVWKKNGVSASSVNQKLYDIKISALSGDFMSVISEWYVGDIMGYEKDGGVWKKNGAPAAGINRKLYDLKVSQLTGGIDSTIEGWYVGDVMGKYTEDNVTWYDDASLDEAGKVSGTNAKLYALTIGDIKNGFIDAIADWRVGEVMGYENVGGVWKNESGEPAAGVNRKLYDLTVSQLTGNVDSIISAWYVGDLLGKYTEDNVTWYDDASLDEASKVTGVNAKLYALTIGDIKGDFITAIGDWTLGEILGRDTSTGIDGLLLAKTIDELTSESFDEIAGSWYVGNILGATKFSVDEGGNPVEEIAGSEDGKWFKDDQVCEDNVQDFYDITIDTLLNNDFGDIVGDIVKDWKIGVLLGYYKNAGVWYRTRSTTKPYTYDDEVTGITATLADKTVSEVSADGGFKAIIDGLKLGDVVDTSGNALLSKLGNSSIGELSSDIDSLQIGDVMGYEKGGDGKWRKGGSEVNELIALIADYTVSGVQDADIVSDVMENVTIGAFYPEAGDPNSENGFLALIDPEWKIGELTTKVNEVVKNANVGALIKLNAFGTFLPYEVTKGEVMTAYTGVDNDDRTIIGYYDLGYVGATDVLPYDTDGDGVDDYDYVLDYSNYKLLDELFRTDAPDANTDGTISDGESRAYWLSLEMPEFMGKLMTVMTTMSGALVTAQETIAELTDYQGYSYYSGYALAKGFDPIAYADTKTYYATYLAASSVDRAYYEYMMGFCQFVNSPYGVNSFDSYNAALALANQ